MEFDFQNSASEMHEIESNSIDTVIMTFVLCSVPESIIGKNSS